MEIIYADITLKNANEIALVKKGIMHESEVKSISVNAMCDSGAFMLAMPEHIATQLDLPQVESREFRMADGSAAKLPVVGPVWINFKNRQTVCFAVATKDSEVLLGAIPMEDMDVVLDMKNQRMDINPDSPYYASMKMK
jgi:clan AA aspartic protease